MPGRIAEGAGSMTYRIAVLPGDGIGPEVTREAVRVLEAVGAAAGIRFEFVEAPIGGAAVDATGDPFPPETEQACLAAEDPGARAVPFLMSGGTDAKAWDALGVRCFGFAPLRLPPDLDFVGMFHGVDERVPVESLEFGARVLSADGADGHAGYFVPGTTSLANFARVGVGARHAVTCARGLTGCRA